MREIGRAFLDGFLTLIMPGIVVGGIVFGVVTITETGVLACLYALILGLFYREIRLDNFWAMAKETAKGVSNLLIILAAAGFFGYVVPRPPGCETVQLGPHNSGWVEDMGEWMMPYEEVRNRPDPRATILGFLGGMYEVATSLGGWEAAEHVRPPASRRGAPA